MLAALTLGAVAWLIRDAMRHALVWAAHGVTIVSTLGMALVIVLAVRSHWATDSLAVFLGRQTASSIEAPGPGTAKGADTSGYLFHAHSQGASLQLAFRPASWAEYIMLPGTITPFTRHAKLRHDAPGRSLLESGIGGGGPLRVAASGGLLHLTVASWFAACGLALPPCAWLGVAIDRRRRRCLQLARGSLNCPRCQYDLRATPHRCPECGLSFIPESQATDTVAG